MAKIRANIYDKAYVPSLGRGPFMNKVIHEELFRSLKRLGYVVEDADAEVSDRLVFEEVDEGFLIDGVAGSAPVSVETFYKLTNSSDAPEVPTNAYRNFAQFSTSEWSNAYTDFNGNENQLINISKVLTDGMHVGDTLKARVVVKYDNIVPVEGKTVEICMQGDGNVTEWGDGGFPHTEPKTLSGSGEIVLECTETLTSDHLKNGWWNWQFRVDYVASGSIQFKENKVEIGQDFTPYTPAPEQLGWSTATLVPTQSQRYLWKFEYVHYSDGSIKITQPTILSIVGASTPQQPEPPKDETVVSPEPPKGDGDSSTSDGQQPPLGDTDSGTEQPPQTDDDTEQQPSVGGGNTDTEQQPSVGGGNENTEQQPPQVGGNENTDQQPSVGDGDSVQTPNPDGPKVDENEAPKVDTAEEPKADVTETQEGTTEEPKVETAETPVETTEAPKAEATETPVETTEEPKVDATETQVETTEAPKADETEAPKVETAEEPKVDATETPVETTEAPKADETEEPKVETAEEPKVDATEEPKVETAEEPKAEATETQVGETEEPKADATETQVETTEAPKAEETAEAPKADATEAQTDVEDKKAVENKVQLTDDEVKFLTSNAKRQEIIDLLTEKGVHIENENATIAELLNLVGLKR